MFRRMRNLFHFIIRMNLCSSRSKRGWSRDRTGRILVNLLNRLAYLDCKYEGLCTGGAASSGISGCWSCTRIVSLDLGILVEPSCSPLGVSVVMLSESLGINWVEEGKRVVERPLQRHLAVGVRSGQSARTWPRLRQRKHARLPLENLGQPGAAWPDSWQYLQ